MTDLTWNIDGRKIVLNDVYQSCGIITSSLKANSVVSSYENLDDYLKNALSFEKKIYSEHARLLKEKKRILKLETTKAIWGGIDTNQIISVFEGYPKYYRIMSEIERLVVDGKKRSDFVKTIRVGDAIGGVSSYDVPVTRLDFLLKDKSTDDKIVAWITSSDDADDILSKVLYSETGDTISVQIVPELENPHFAEITGIENHSLNQRLSPKTNSDID